jgi:phosphoribosylformimino-5-aminoimidazole carboxamide ribonucleotide (ProFAR) isomerase
LEKKVGKEKLIVDISCRRREDGWVVAMNGWKTLTDMWVTQGMSFSPPFIPEPPFCSNLH